MGTTPQPETESQSERIRKLELRAEAMAKEPDSIRAEFRAAILESEMRMKEYVDQRFERFAEYVDQRLSRLEARVDFHFKILMSMQTATIAGIIAIAVRLLFMD